MNAKKIFIRICVGAMISLPAITNAQTVTDIEGRNYKTIIVGKQGWMAENLNVSRFRNGDPIPETKTNEEWIKAGKEGKPAWCYYNNTSENGKKYGKLYNWYAVNDARGLAPQGWHIPSKPEWTMFIDYLGGEASAVTKIQSTSGFSGLMGGSRDNSGNFSNIDEASSWWSSTEFNPGRANHLFLHIIVESVDGFDSNKSDGLFVRCIKD